MTPVYVIADNVFSPLGATVKENFDRITGAATAVAQHYDVTKSDKPFMAALFHEEALTVREGLTRFEELLVRSVENAVKGTAVDLRSSRLGFIISSTKGNISLLENEVITGELKDRIAFSSSAAKIKSYFGLVHDPLVVSHACISGLVAMITARRLICTGKYDTVIVAGADVITKFILSGFQSFHAVSDDLCRPFDAGRAGINLGEAGATVILSAGQHRPGEQIVFTGGAVSNDANHISGPSRTGQELAQAIKNAMEEAGVKTADVDFISAHGTATVYNDDMESKAITICGLQDVPVNSLKGYYGHTLGAAGILETVISIQSLRENKIIPTKGFATPGTAENINVCHTLQTLPLNCCVKTASGFGGCNAAVILEKKD